MVQGAWPRFAPRLFAPPFHSESPMVTSHSRPPPLDTITWSTRDGIRTRQRVSTHAHYFGALGMAVRNGRVMQAIGASTCCTVTLIKSHPLAAWTCHTCSQGSDGWTYPVWLSSKRAATADQGDILDAHRLTTAMCTTPLAWLRNRMSPLPPTGFDRPDLIRLCIKVCP